MRRIALVLALWTVAGCVSHDAIVRRAEARLDAARHEHAQARARVLRIETGRDRPKLPQRAPATDALPRPVLVVLDVDDEEGLVSYAERDRLSAYFGLTVVEADRFYIVPRAAMRRELQDEKARSVLRPCYDDECRLELGKALAAGLVLHPQLLPDGEDCIFAATLYDLRSETAVWARSEETACTKAALFAAARTLAHEVGARAEGGAQ